MVTISASLHSHCCGKSKLVLRPQLCKETFNKDCTCVDHCQCSQSGCKPTRETLLVGADMETEIYFEVFKEQW